MVQECFTCYLPGRARFATSIHWAVWKDVGADRRSPDDIPKQLNGCDCGVFALMFAEYQSRDAPFTFDQRHMEYFRVKVLADIMSERVESPLEAA